ncbi:MAG TPA: S41 family peptidase [Gammaproteobacteria bacterium]
MLSSCGVGRTRAPLSHFAVGLALVAGLGGVPLAQAQHNGGFELAASAAAPAGWETERAALDAAVALRGARSVRLDADGSRAARIAQHRPPDLPGNRVRFSAYLKTQDVRGGEAALYIRVDGPAGLLYADRLRERGATGTSGWTRYSVEAPLFPEATRLSFGVVLDGAGSAWIDEATLESLDTAELPPPSPAAARYVEEALDIMRRHSLHRGRVDWEALRAETLAQARGAATETDAYLAVNYALRRLGDGHSYLLGASRSRALSEAPVSNARTGRPPLDPRTAMLDGEVAYLWLPGFAGGTPLHQVAFANALHDLIAAGDATSCGWIVDLRDNRGGNLWPMLAGVGPLLGEGELGASVFPEGRTVALSYIGGQARLGEYTQLRVSRVPYRLANAHKPVAVLTSDDTASAGEVIAAAFRGRPNTLSFGEPTSGVSTGTRTFTLRDGASMVLTVAATRDRSGRVWSGPITPDRLVDAERAGLPLEDQPAVRAALAWLRDEHACPPASAR